MSVNMPGLLDAPAEFREQAEHGFDPARVFGGRSSCWIGRHQPLKFGFEKGTYRTHDYRPPLGSVIANRSVERAWKSADLRHSLVQAANSRGTSSCRNPVNCVETSQQTDYSLPETMDERVTVCARR